MENSPHSSDWSRRTFVKASLFTLLALSGGTNAWASLFSEQQRSAASLNLLHTHTGERLAVTYREPGRSCDPQALASIDHLLRCHYTNEVHPIDVRTLDYLAQLDQSLGGGHEIHIISGYRSPLYNEKLRGTGNNGVARNSLHLLGKALDIRIPGIELGTLRRIALGLQCGGVGFYPRTDFLHIDSGRFRFW